MSMIFFKLGIGFDVLGWKGQLINRCWMIFIAVQYTVWCFFVVGNMSSCDRVPRQTPLIRLVSRFPRSRWPRWWGHNGYTLARAVDGHRPTIPKFVVGKAKPNILTALYTQNFTLQSGLPHKRANNSDSNPQSWGVRRQCVLGAQWLKACDRRIPCSGPRSDWWVSLLRSPYVFCLAHEWGDDLGMSWRI